MACGSCGSGRSFKPATYTVKDDSGNARTFLTKTEAVLYAARNGGTVERQAAERR